jgi:hypothetical protein
VSAGSRHARIRYGDLRDVEFGPRKLAPVSDDELTRRLSLDGSRRTNRR